MTAAVPLIAPLFAAPRLQPDACRKEFQDARH
jgi:hypothetical protein